MSSFSFDVFALRGVSTTACSLGVILCSATGLAALLGGGVFALRGVSTAAALGVMLCSATGLAALFGGGVSAMRGVSTAAGIGGIDLGRGLAALFFYQRP